MVWFGGRKLGLCCSNLGASEMSIYVALWGAVLSTLLAVVKIWEIWRERFRLEIGYNFSDNIVVGNKIILRNLSGKPIILSYWELLHCTGNWPRKVLTSIAYPDHDESDRRIDPYSTLELSFTEQNYFEWGRKALRGGKILIRLHIAGRKPILQVVYP